MIAKVAEQALESVDFDVKQALRQEMIGRASAAEETNFFAADIISAAEDTKPAGIVLKVDLPSDYGFTGTDIESVSVNGVEFVRKP